MSLKQEFELLRRVPIFAEIEPAKLKLLAFMSERVGFDPGKRLMQQGDPADAAYLIIDGHAEVILAHPKGAVYARCAEIPDYCRLDNAGIGRGGSAEEKQNAVSD